MRRLLLVCVILWSASQPAVAQYAARQLHADAASAADLVFPAEPTPRAEATTPRMLLLRPEGNGPFPAVVLGHQCGGLIFSKTNPKAANWSMLDWAHRFTEAGYVTLLVDFLSARGGQAVCQFPQGGVTFGRSTKDFLQAAEHLRALPYVDGRRVAMVGYSQGALIAFFANSAGVRKGFGLGRGYDAYVSFYPYCGYSRNGPDNYAGNIVQDDLDTPHLVLTGGQDTETPAADCDRLLAPLEAAGKPVRRHHYPDATHCWDCKSLDGYSKQGHFGPVVYRYDEAITRDSRERTLAFLREVLKPRAP